MSRYNQKIFNGIVTNVDLIDIKNNYSSNAENIYLGKVGELKRVDGFQKEITTGLGYQIDSLFRLNSTNFVLYNGTIATL
jgi:hypothetical protein